ncbi:MAG: DNA polymerase III subunit beta [Pseudoflavonifractor sp.]|nr:DNA polymerase III subunit beta [Alloprevotella sp.]MCM1117155.1 DNA polymerase III subunit beta [Pseudoflavonifractor sp.]
MKFNVSSKTLYSSLSAVSKVINSKNALAVLNNFLFTLRGNHLHIRASDMENSLDAILEVMDADGEGSFCLDAHRMVDLLKEMPQQDMAFDIDDSSFEATISYTNGEFKTMAIDGAEYPAPEAQEDAEETVRFSCPASVAIAGIERTLFAVGSDELRPQMTGILWDIKPDRIIFVATDTRKLVRYSNSAVAPGSECSFILPLKPATVLRNIFGKDVEIDITISKKSVTFTSATYTFDCRFIKGMFPDYNRVIPRTNDKIVTVDRQSFINSVRRVTVFGNGGNGLVRFAFADNQVILSVQDSNYGTSGRESLSCDYQGAPITIGFGAPYLQEIFSTIPTPEVIIQLADPSRPAVFLPAENEPDSNLLMILMPMSIVE